MKTQSLWILFFVLFLSACAKTEEPPPVAPTRDGRVDAVRMEGGDWGYPTPFAHYPRGPGSFKMALIFDSLLERDDKGLIPWLASSWHVSDDGKTYTFTLQENVTWQDGTPFTAEDVSFSLMYLQKHPTPWAIVYGMVESAHVINDHTVAIMVREPGVPCLYAIGLARIIPRHIWESVDKPKTYTEPDAVVGTGPYRLTAYSREHGIYRFEASDTFWGPRQRVKALEYIPVSDPVLAFEAGQIDIMEVPPDLMPRYKDHAKYGLIRCPPFWGYRLLMNMKRHDILTNREVRKSIRYALNLDDMVHKIARDAAVPGMAGILPPGHVMYNPEQVRYTFDPEKAKALLKAQGLEPGDERLRFELLVSSRNDKEVRLGEMIVQALNQMGMTVTLTSVDTKTRDSRVRELNYDLAVLGHGGWGMDVDHLKYRFCENAGNNPSAYGYSGYTNPELNRLFDEQHLAFDSEKRRQLVNRIQALLAEEVPEIPLFYGMGQVVYRKAVYDGWMNMFDHHAPSHSKLTWLDRRKGRL